MKLIAATALAVIVMASSPTYAADLFGTAPQVMDPVSTSPGVEVGSNWYLRGDVGYGVENSPTIVPSAGLLPPILNDPSTGVAYTNQPPGNTSNAEGAARGNNKDSDNMNFDLGVGYRFNNWLRVDATYNFWRGAGLSFNAKSLCPETALSVSNNTVSASGALTTTPAGYLWAPASCTGYLNAQQYNNLALATAYVDLGNYWGFTPYIGAGVGMNANTITGSTAFYNNNDGAPALGNTSASTAGTPLTWVTQTGVNSSGYAVYKSLGTQPNVAFGNQNYNRTISATHYSVAGALTAGFGYDLTPSATLDISYRYLSADLFGSTKNTSQQVRVGIRYMAD